MNPQDLLGLLKDIDAPPPPAWWLPGEGHYLVTALLAMALILLAWRVKKRRTDHWRRLATAELDGIAGAFSRHKDPLQLARELAVWTRRVSRLAYPEQSPGKLLGRDWLEFLDGPMGQDRFANGAGQVFADDIYRRDAAIDAAGLIALCRDWLRAIAPLLRHGSGR